MSISPNIGAPLPHGWKRTQLRRLVDIRNGRDYKAVEVAEGGYPVYGSGGEFRRASDFLYDGESILFGRKGTVDRPLYVDGKFWTVDTMYYAVPLEQVNGRFLYYLSTTIPFKYYVTSTALPSVTQSDLAGHPVNLPPLDEQRAIAEYLDRETQKIDDLITEQRGLIETLRERRTELIAKAVTRGIDEESLGESAMPWVGAIPEGWSTGRIKHLGQVTLGKMLQSRGKEGDVEAPYMRAANIQPDGVVVENDFKTMWFSPAELRTLDLCRGDVVVVEGGVGGYGRAAFLSRSLRGLGYQNSVNRIRPFGEGRFIAYYLQAVRAKGFIRAYCNIVSMPHLTAEKLESMPVPIPPDGEQRRISDYLDEQTSRIDELISESEDLIALSQERRAALITAAVTGQIDVRTTA